MNLKLTEKTALVSGSTKGIGFGIAIGLVREGARVIVNGRSEKAVAAAREQICKAVPEAKIEGFAGDLSTAAATETLLQRFPFVDILVNNLGIFEPKPFGDIPDEDWRRFFEINVLSGVRLSRAYLPGMRRPVSYTHLDVYKRQGASGFPLSSSRATATSPCQCKP